MITDLRTAVRVLKEEQENHLAFVFGNGINRYAYNDESHVSWEKMLLNIWSEVSSKTLSTISEGVSYTEFYQIIELEGIDISNLRKRVVEYTKNFYQPTEYHGWLCRRLQNWYVPVLTTNFDSNLEFDLKMFRLHKTEGVKRGFTDYYPWDVYYSPSKINFSLDEFAVWHINGMVKYPRSLKLGLAEYINQTARARDFFHKNEKMMDFDLKNQPYWNGSNTWLHIILNSSLCFCGLELDVNETFLRWLLLERARYFKKFPDRRKKGWYICKDNVNEGKRLFLESTGIEIIKLNDFSEIYEGIFE